MDIENKLDKLKKIREVEAPSFLFTRIKQGILNLEQAVAPLSWKWVFATMAFLLMALNIFIFVTRADAGAKQGIDQVIDHLQLSNSNQLYHE